MIGCYAVCENNATHVRHLSAGGEERPIRVVGIEPRRVIEKRTINLS
jgi:hypothetical protein